MCYKSMENEEKNHNYSPNVSVARETPKLIDTIPFTPENNEKSRMAYV